MTKKKQEFTDTVHHSVTHHTEIKMFQIIKKHEQLFCYIIRKVAYKCPCKHFCLKPIST